MICLTLSDHISKNDPVAHNRVVSTIKRSFSRSLTVISFLKKHRREEVWHKKDGSKAKNPKVFYSCNHCKQEFRSNHVQVDHIEPVIPLNIPSRHTSYNTIVARTFCDESNLQILCKKHHSDKSAVENATRDEWQGKIKYIVYETTNRQNFKKYIGVHKCIDYDDIYFGSGNLLKAAVRKYGKENFYRSIMFVFDNAEEAFAKEHELVNDEVITSDCYYNLAIGGSGNVPGTYVDTRKKVICHQTGKVFNSINDVAKDINVSSSSVSKALNNPHQPVKNLHFFSLDVYDEKVIVSFPDHGRPVIHLGTFSLYQSIQDAATTLSLNYKSLRNAMRDPDDLGICQLNDEHFLYSSNYDSSFQYFVIKMQVQLVQLAKTFSSYTEAATFLKHKKPVHGGIAIGKAVRTGGKVYGYNWKIVETKVFFKKRD